MVCVDFKWTCIFIILKKENKQGEIRCQLTSREGVVAKVVNLL